MAGTALLGFWSSGGEYGGTMLQVLVCAYSHGPGRRQSPAFVAARAGSKRALTRIYFTRTKTHLRNGTECQRVTGCLALGKCSGRLEQTVRSPAGLLLMKCLQPGLLTCTQRSPLYIPNIPNDTYMLTCPVLHYYIYGIRRAHPNHLGILDQMMACYMQ